MREEGRENTAVLSLASHIAPTVALSSLVVAIVGQNQTCWNSMYVYCCFQDAKMEISG